MDQEKSTFISEVATLVTILGDVTTTTGYCCEATNSAQVERRYARSQLGHVSRWDVEEKAWFSLHCCFKKGASISVFSLIQNQPHVTFYLPWGPSLIHFAALARGTRAFSFRRVGYKWLRQPPL